MFQQVGIATYYFEIRAWERAVECLRTVDEEAPRLGRAWLKLWAQALLSTCLMHLEPVDEVELERIAAYLSKAEGTPWPGILGGSTLALAEIDIWKGRVEQALERAEAVRADADSDGRIPQVVWAMEVQVLALLRAGRSDEALPVVERAIELADEIGLASTSWRLQAARGDALGALGRSAQATEAYASAAEALRVLADGIPDQDLRTGFLQDDEVARVLELGR